MPNRMVRDWTNSDKVDNISVQAEVFFTRLIMKADDYGCFWADPKRLKANLFPLKSDSIREADILRWMAECQKAGLIVVYESDDKKYLQIVEFGQRKRAMSSKFPQPPTYDRKVRADDSGPPPEVEVEEKGREGPPDLSKSNLFRKPVIPTKQQVWEAISGAGGTKEMAKAFYEKYEGTGWYQNNSPITNYVAVAIKFVDTWKRNENKKTPESPAVTYKTLT